MIAMKIPIGMVSGIESPDNKPHIVRFRKLTEGLNLSDEMFIGRLERV